MTSYAKPDIQTPDLSTPSVRSNVPPFMAMDVKAAAARLEAAGEHIIHMEVGEPAASAPMSALLAAGAAIRRGKLHYTTALGIPSLRQRIAKHYLDVYGQAIDPDRIVVTTGSSGAFLLAFLTMFDPGDRVAVANPGYPPYRHILKTVGCTPVLIETSPDTRYAITPDTLLAEHRKAPLQGLLIASPANPTGTMMTPEALKELIETAEAAGIRVISDEIYHGLDYTIGASTAASTSDNTVIVNSFSKYFCMTGWRVGWMVVPEHFVRTVERLQQSLSISVSTVSQIAAEAAFEGIEEMEAVKRGYQLNRKILIEGLPKIGFTKFQPADGAFYLYADVSAFTDDSLAFTNEMLATAKVAATPGLDFDPLFGRTSVRFSYAGSDAEMHQAVENLGNWLR